ncbi:hypothetical protein [Kitasatospora sp. NPDC094011]|uniref:hypothetical protein n=1 Tax=Kitasatospora sp. NPDC094011 TaxID=3364090 RepID=UPI00380A88EE
MPGLPPIGAEIPCSSLAINTPLKIGTMLVTVDFRGGMKHRVDVNPNDPMNSVIMRLIGLRYTADLPGKDGGADGGTVTIEQSDIDAEPKGRLRLTQQFPPKYENLIDLSTCTMTIDRTDGEPLVLVPKGEATLIGQLTQYPPKGDLYQLKARVEFVDPAKPDDVAAVLEKLPAKVGGL